MTGKANRFDVAILGSGFAGSMLATILASGGRRVALVDTQLHPRAAIGESSTPLADRLLDHLGQQYGQPAWTALSTYGSWKSNHPELGCGLKRGFSYYRHAVDGRVSGESIANGSLLVAASGSDRQGDTHWYRPDVDQFLFHQAIQNGAVDFSGFTVVALDVNSPRCVILQSGDSHQTLVADWVFDATGRAAISATLNGKRELTERLATKSYCRYTHISGLARWSDTLAARGIDTQTDPFDCDAAAQHHLIDGGWIWNLRFDNNITSVGQVMRDPIQTSLLDRADDRADDSGGYVDLRRHLSTGRQLFPPTTTTRLQRFFDPVIGENVLLLPTAAATIDPLHSTGIAMGLAGVARAAELVLAGTTISIAHYRHCLFAEVSLLDRLVSAAYRSLDDFERFTLACQLFFVAAIRSEEQLAADGFDSSRPLYSADCAAVMSAIDAAINHLDGSADATKAFNQLRRMMRPWNQAGLFDPDAGNRYAYTATK